MKNFFANPAEQKVTLLTPDPQEGPDGFPYLFVGTDGSNQENLLSLVKWCAEKGVGLAVNPQKETPDFVFTYGMLWNYTNRGEFLTTTNQPAVPSGEIRVENEQTFYVGTPSESFFPTPQRKIFKEFLLQQGIVQAKMILLSEQKEGPMDLAFSLESLGNPPEAEWDGVLEAFSWFFPRHYSLAMMSETALIGAAFTIL